MTGVGMMNGSAATKPTAGLKSEPAADAAHQQHRGQHVEQHERRLQHAIEGRAIQKNGATIHDCTPSM